MAKKRDNLGFVFSTDEDFEFDYSDQEDEVLENSEQRLRVQHDRKMRKGKTVTLITGFVGGENELKDLAKSLKSQCGVGGSIKDGQIIIQGEKRDQVLKILLKSGYTKTKLVGGK